MRSLLALLLLLVVSCGEEAYRDPGSYEVPAPYMQTLLATQHEWVAAGLPFPEECVTMATRMHLYFDEWEETISACEAIPASAPPDYDAGVELDTPPGYRVSACISSDEHYHVHFDSGLSEGIKHMSFVHEVIHALQYCSRRGRDSTHLDTYAWDTVLPRAQFQVACGGRARFGEEELQEVTCYDAWD